MPLEVIVPQHPERAEVPHSDSVNVPNDVVYFRVASVISVLLRNEAQKLVHTTSTVFGAVCSSD